MPRFYDGRLMTNRTFVIVRHTFREAVVQPIYTLLLALGAAILVVFALLPFFTLGEDTIMFKSVSLDVVLLLVLIATLFATSRSIYEEIEDRTMLTLMSKPLRRWQVLLGKYLGISLAALLAVAILGAILILCLWWRIPGDYQLRTGGIDERDIRQLLNLRLMHVLGAGISLVQIWLQVSVLAAIGVALSTRFSLVVNLPVVILLYIAGNLTRFLFPLSGGVLADSGTLVQSLAWLLSLILPYLQMFDLKEATVYGKLALQGSEFAADPHAFAIGRVWLWAGLSALYAAAYAAFALSVGLWLFQTRDLGGAEG